VAPFLLEQLDQPVHIIRLNRVFRHPICSLKAAAETTMHNLVSFPGFLPQVDRLHQPQALVHPIPRQPIHVFRKQAKRTVVAIASIIHRRNLPAAIPTHESYIFCFSAHADLLELI
jgi:hypothetical protein